MNNYYAWDEITETIEKIEYPDKNEFQWELVGLLDGVTEWRSDRGHLGLSCHAPNRRVAWSMMTRHPSYIHYNDAYGK